MVKKYIFPPGREGAMNTKQTLGKHSCFSQTFLLLTKESHLQKQMSFPQPQTQLTKDECPIISQDICTQCKTTVEKHESSTRDAKLLCVPCVFAPCTFGGQSSTNTETNEKSINYAHKPIIPLTLHVFVRGELTET